VDELLIVPSAVVVDLVFVMGPVFEAAIFDEHEEVT
jgi:hypothetical protein